ncbi:cytochrome P450 [Dactylosporangium sp. NPDC050588]|uniref:Putative cytochrome P450 n=1 Tax=Dactylosporangium aurantiacum subsp. hamdenensis TaxID=703577 RepID=E9LIP3_9ACTN|nr:putative cytochrome P450 [Dactylosporangium aurantiacum subsp. hamdenensis]
MTDTVSNAPALPTARTSPFDPPEPLRELRQHCPVSHMTFPDGHVGRLVTSHAAARSVLADSRFSSRQELLRSPIPLPMPEPRVPADPGNFIRLDPPEQTRYRRLLMSQFTARRLKQLEPRITEIVHTQLEAMAAAGTPADLIPVFALPIPSQVICELLGVPFEQRDQFQRDLGTLLNVTSSLDAIVAAHRSADSFVEELVLNKRARPADDLLSSLAALPELTVQELKSMAFLLFAAGYETTANMLGLGTFALLTAPDQLAALKADDTLVENAVEELLRYLTIIHIGPVRTALADVEVDGVAIREGESVTLSLSAANRDPAKFADPDTFDIKRNASGHLAFGHGAHQCLGAQLARMEMRIAYTGLFRRFPKLRLAVPAEEVEVAADMTIYGVHRLPVRWD